MQEQRADAATQVLHWSLSAGGALDVVLWGEAARPLALELADAGGNRAALAPEPARERPVNLLRADGAPPVWRPLSNAAKAEAGTDYRPKWRIANEPTGFVKLVGKSTEAAGLELLDAAGNRFTPLLPLARYSFALLAAAHRCEGAVRLVLMDDKRAVLRTLVSAFDDARQGGTDPASYWDVRLDFITPPGAAWLSVVLEKLPRALQPGEAEPARPAEQFLFFADPVLVQGALGEEREALRLPLPLLAEAQGGRGGARLFRAAVPPDLMAGAPLRATLRDGAGRVLGEAELAPAPGEDFAAGDFLVEGGAVSLAGRLAEGAQPPHLALFVDGEAGDALAVSVEGGRVLAQGELPERFVSGQRHTVDIRLLPEGRVVARRSLVLALPATGGLWARRLDNLRLAHDRVAGEAALLREALQKEQGRRAAPYAVYSKVARLAPLFHALSEDFALLDELPEREAPAHLPDETLLSASGFFNEEWYRQTYLGGARKPPPTRHYLEEGHAAGLFPHPLFHSEWYRAHYMGGAAESELPFLHFIRSGARRGFAPHPLFDLDWFARRYNQRGIKQAMVFFARYGLELELDPHPLFASAWYNRAYPEARARRLTAVHHYSAEGWREGNFPNPLFDPLFYAAQAGLAPGAAEPLAHFIETGSDRGLDPNPWFSSTWYRASNPDVAGRWIPLAHYLRIGAAERRDPGPNFDTVAYLAAHPHLNPAREAPLTHFMRVQGKAPAAAPPEALLANPLAPALAGRTETEAAAGAAEKQRAAEPPSVNWVIGPENNLGWAYGNNARRFAEHMPGWTHEISGGAEADVALFFDVLVAERFPARGRRRVARVGGARPLDRLFGSDPAALRKGLESFDALISLSPSLQRRVSAVHPNAVFIPNGLDLARWSPDNLRREEDRPFTAGFAASAASAAERDVKGLDIAVEAARLAGVPLARVHKGEGQVAHERMIEDFYSGIDVLLHPVAAGREGCSNVIMEAVSLGLPVITTVDSGFHGEIFADGAEAFLRPRDPEAIAEALGRLRDDATLRAAMGERARQFALAHHDIGKIASAYEEVFRRTLVHGGAARKSVAFLPFWKPTEKFASSRLRADMPADLLSEKPTPVSVAREDFERAEVAVVVQSAETPLMERLEAAPEQFVVYDVCDRYFENARTFQTPSGEVDSLERFEALMGRANAVIAPTRELKAELAARFPHKPVFFVPELIDYSRGFRDAAPVSPKRVVWFGSPQRGNFDSARWLLDALREKHGYDLKIVSRRGHFSALPDYAPVVSDWRADTFLDELAAASLTVVSHAQEEQTKSPNRFVTAVAHGVPAIVSNSRPSAALLESAGCGWAAVCDERELAEALRRLEDPAERRNYLARVQAVIEREHGDAAVRESYLRLFLDRTYDPGRREPPRVAFVSHNLNFGEGAPKSLFEVVTGLARSGAVEPFLYCAARGELEGAYAQAGIPVVTFSEETVPPVRVLNRAFEAVRREFKAFLERERIDHVVANTVKAAPFALFAAEAGVPATVIIRESFEKERRFDYFLPPVARAAERALLAAGNVVFVSRNTARLWADQPMTPDIRLIPNGVSSAPFAETLAMSKDEARAKLGLEDADLVAICVGTVNERKGQAELLEWFVALPEPLRARLTILFVGATEGPGLEGFRAIYDKLPHDLQEHLVTVPTTPEIGVHYRASDLFLMNSTQESYPRSTMEALLFGLPVVSTPVFGVLEQVSEAENGFTYPFGDMAAWHDRLGRLLADDALRERMAAAAKSSFWKLTTYAEMLHDYRCIVSAGGSVESAAPVP